MTEAFVRRGAAGQPGCLAIPAFEQQGAVVAAFSTRTGGVSPWPYQSLNMALHVGDAPENVIVNRSRFFTSLGIDPAAVVACRQVHGDRIAAVDGRDRGRGADDEVTALADTDALVTDCPGVPLTMYFADCMPLFLWDPVHRVIGLAHAGWRGTVLKIGTQTLRYMSEHYGSEPASCLAALGPAIGPCCYEVDERVVEPVRTAFPFWRELLSASGDGKWRLNLWEANARSLQFAGMPSENILISGTCTSCRIDLLFSYRAEQGVTGRMAAVLMIKDRPGEVLTDGSPGAVNPSKRQAAAVS